MNNTQIQKLIDQAMVEENKKQVKRNYLGASRWGEKCTRKLAYEFHGFKSDKPFSGNTLRIFNVGHDGEERMAEYMRIAGFDILTHKDDGKQIGFEAAEGKLKGHIDGAIRGGPAVDGLSYPCLWENKMLGKKSFDDLCKKGLKDSKPIYYAQVNIYMGYMELPQALFTAQNRDTCEIYAEVVDFDARNAQECSDRAVAVVGSRNPDEFPRITNDPQNFQCKFCDFHDTCHNTFDGEISGPMTPYTDIFPYPPKL